MIPHRSTNRFRLVSRVRDSRLFHLAESMRDAIWYVRAARRGSFAQHGEDLFC